MLRRSAELSIVGFREVEIMAYVNSRASYRNTRTFPFYS
jgi:hypothetical protein